MRAFVSRETKGGVMARRDTYGDYFRGLVSRATKGGVTMGNDGMLTGESLKTMILTAARRAMGGAALETMLNGTESDPVAFLRAVEREMEHEASQIAQVFVGAADEQHEIHGEEKRRAQLNFEALLRESREREASIGRELADERKGREDDFAELRDLRALRKALDADLAIMRKLVEERDAKVASVLRDHGALTAQLADARAHIARALDNEAVHRKLANDSQAREREWSTRAVAAENKLAGALESMRGVLTDYGLDGGD